MIQAKSDAIAAKNKFEKEKNEIKLKNFKIQYEKDRKLVDLKLDILKKEKDSANQEKKIAQFKAKEAKAKSDAMKNAMSRVGTFYSELVKEPFYKSKFINIDEKNKYLNTLVSLKIESSHDSRQLKQYLSYLNKRAEVINMSQTDPNLALLKAQKDYKDSGRSELSKSILLDVAQTNLFYSKKLELPSFSSSKDLYHQFSLTALSKNRKTLAYLNGSTIMLYEIANNDLQPIRTINLSIADTDVKAISTSISSVPTLTVTDDNYLLFFTPNNNLYKIDFAGIIKSQINITDLIKDNDSIKSSLNEEHYASSISADGKILALDYNDYDVILLKINEKNQDPKIISLDKNEYVQNVCTSADGNKLIIMQSDKYKIYDAINKYPLKELNDTYNYASFSDDGKYIIAQNKEKIYMYETEHGKKEDLTFNNFFLLNNNSSITLSPDRQNMIVKTTLADFSSAINYFKRDKPNSYKLSDKKMPYLKNSTIFFTENHNIIDIPNYLNYQSYDLSPIDQYIRIWKDYGQIKSTDNLDSIFKTIPSFDDFDKFKAGLISHDEIADEATLVKLAQYYSSEYNNPSSVLKVQELYEQALKKTTSLDSKIDYLDNMRESYRVIFAIDSSYQKIVATLKEIVSNEEEILKKNVDVKKYNTVLSNDYWNLSWYQLFLQEYTGAVSSAQRGYELDSRNNGIKTNLALGYLLSGQCENAILEYKTLKGTVYKTDGKEFTSAFLKDFDALEEAGVISKTKTNAQIYNLVQRIKDFLNNETNILDCK